MRAYWREFPGGTESTIARRSACRRCGAKVGEPCAFFWGRLKTRWGYHLGRWPGGLDAPGANPIRSRRKELEWLALTNVAMLGCLFLGFVSGGYGWYFFAGALAFWYTASLAPGGVLIHRARTGELLPPWPPREVNFTIGRTDYARSPDVKNEITPEEVEALVKGLH